jgi:hypothetical protein
MELCVAQSLGDVTYVVNDELERMWKETVALS